MKLKVLLSYSSYLGTMRCLYSIALELEKSVFYALKKKYSSEISAQERSNLCYLMCLRRLISRAVTNRKCKMQFPSLNILPKYENNLNWGAASGSRAQCRFQSSWGCRSSRGPGGWPRARTARCLPR